MVQMAMTGVFSVSVLIPVAPSSTVIRLTILFGTNFFITPSHSYWKQLLLFCSYHITFHGTLVFFFSHDTEKLQSKRTWNEKFCFFLVFVIQTSSEKQKVSSGNINSICDKPFDRPFCYQHIQETPSKKFRTSESVTCCSVCIKSKLPYYKISVKT